MSKSDPDSMVDPLDLIKQYGADALRFGLVYQLNYGSQAVKFDEDAVKAARNFANKIWNMARLLDVLPEQDEPTLADAWIADQLGRLAQQVTADLAAFRLGEAAHAIHEFLWGEYADWYLEILKAGGSTKTARRVFADALALLHPFMPHLTEVLWEQNGSGGLLILTPWPQSGVSPAAAENRLAMARVQAVVTAVRSARTLFDIPPAETVRLHVPGELPLTSAVAALCRAEVAVQPEENMQQLPLPDGGVIHLSAPVLNKDALIRADDRLAQEAAAVKNRLASLTRQLEQMRDKAPASVLAEKQHQAAIAEQRLQEITTSRRLLTP